MSQIADIYEALLVRLNTLYPEQDGWNRLSNPYKPEENPDIFLRQGWAIAIGPALNTERLLNCRYSVERTITITLTRMYEALENDAINKSSTEVQLLQDQHLLILDLEQDTTVNGSSVQTTYRTDGGMEYVRGETDRFLMLRSDVTLEYFESLED